MHPCYCCGVHTEDYAWCSQCGPTLKYKGDLRFYCPVHEVTIQIGLLEAARMARPRTKGD